jgi:hypothetical protein
MMMSNPDQPPTPPGVAAENIFADTEGALARIDALNEQFEREELKERLGLWPDPNADECG